MFDGGNAVGQEKIAREGRVTSSGLAGKFWKDSRTDRFDNEMIVTGTGTIRVPTKRVKMKIDAED